MVRLTLSLWFSLDMLRHKDMHHSVVTETSNLLLEIISIIKRSEGHYFPKSFARKRTPIDATRRTEFWTSQETALETNFFLKFRDAQACPTKTDYRFKQMPTRAHREKIENRMITGNKNCVGGKPTFWVVGCFSLPFWLFNKRWWLDRALQNLQ